MVQVAFTLTLLAFYIIINEGKINPYEPYNISFNSDGFEWQGQTGSTLNIPGYDRISFMYTTSSSDPVTEIKYGIRIVSMYDYKLLQKPIYILANDGPKMVFINVSDTLEFGVVIRGMIRVPNRFVDDSSVKVWSVQDTGILFRGYNR